MYRTWLFSFAALVATMAGPPAGAAPPVVHSEAPARPPRTVTLQELWRVGGEDDPHVFGTLIEARSDAAGDVDLLDQQLSRVSVLALDGRWLEELHVRCPGDPAHDGLIFLDDDRVLLVKGLVLARLTASGTGGVVTDETGGAWAIEVVCCRIAG